MSNLNKIDFKKLNFVIDKKLKYLLFLLALASVFISLLELIGIGMLASLVLFISDIEKFISNLPDLKILNYFKGLTQIELISYFLVLVVLFFLIKNLLIFIFTYSFNKLRVAFNFNITKKLLHKYLNQNYSFFLNRNNSKLIHDVREETVRFTGIFFQLINVIKEIFLILFLISSIFIINWKVTLIVSLSLFFFSAIIFLIIKRKLYELGKSQTIFSSSFLKRLLETFSDIKFIKIKSIENFFFKKILDAQKKLLNVGLFTSTIIVIPRLILEVLAVLGLCITIYFVLKINLSFNEIVPFLTLLSLSIVRMVPAITSLNNGINSISTHLISLEIVSKHFDDNSKVQIELKNKSIAKKEKIFSIELKNIYFKYFSQKEFLLKNISFGLNKNDILGIIGQSGSGKTTLGDILNGTLMPQKGEMVINGQSILNSQDLSKFNISYVPQSINVIDENLNTNIAYGIEKLEINKDEVDKLKAISDLNNLGKEFNYDSMGESGINISGGQKQRIGIARAFYGNPDLVILDEPTSELDYKIEGKIINNLKVTSKDKILILIAHRLNTLEICNKLLILNDGQILDYGSKEEIMEKHNYLKNYFKKTKD
tara:strand:- start:2759 stop:4555 length:1797 start_codon:yes stop_codon:yes gene_type:complete